MDKWKLHHGDCLKVMQQLKDEGIQVHSVVTDPPYHLASIVSRFGKEGSAPTVDQGVFRRSSTGFMGKEWDGGDIAFKVETWKLCYDLLLPGGHLVAFAATKNYHRMACAIEDAGFEIRDQLGWLYGTGFPKSHDVGKGMSTALKPAWEPICLARKPISEKTIKDNVELHGVGGLRIEDCRVGNKGGTSSIGEPNYKNKVYGKGLGGLKIINENKGRWPANVITDGSFDEPHFNYFYSAKESKDERFGSKHPTVKPVALMRYLTRLVTPEGGTILDPFAGSGTTLQAGVMEGFTVIGIEKDLQYMYDIEHRMAASVDQENGNLEDFMS